MDLNSLYQIYLKSSGVSTDTRKIRNNELFFALSGPNFNGNQYAAKALEKGAVCAVVDDKMLRDKEGFFYVEDTLIALQRLARFHRDQQSMPFIGITGSNGKTTTKELLASVLSQKYTVHYTQGNLNNHIGVPLTLLSIPVEAEIAIIEMGANKIGDIEELCGIADPDYALITNIGKAHIEGFGSVEGIARGKSELYYHVLKKGGTVFFNGADEKITMMASRFDKKVQYLGEHTDCQVSFISAHPYIKFSFEGIETQTNLIGKYNFVNIAAALCMGRYFEVNGLKAAEAIESYQSDNNRSEVRKVRTNTVLLDAYNANPTSMRAALDSFKEYESENKVVILGDMFELGKDSEKEHQELVAYAESLYDQCVFCGKLLYGVKNQRSQFFEERESLMSWLNSQRLEHKEILIKGSRGMRLEECLAVI